MKLDKKYSFTNNRQIWRLLITDSNKLIVEDRDINEKQAYFNCLDITLGNIIFRNLQLEEKYWIGIETIYKDIIYFHKFAKPNMPGHNTIIAFDIARQRIFWQTDDYNFLFIFEDKIYSYIQRFEGREFFTLDYLTGNLLEELGNKPERVNSLKKNIHEQEKYKDYYFPNVFKKENVQNALILETIQKVIKNPIIEGNLEYVIFQKILLFNFYKRNPQGSLDNDFYAINLEKGKTLIKDRINTNANAYVPDSFFIKDNLLFLLKEKTKLEIYLINKT